MPTIAEYAAQYDSVAKLSLIDKAKLRKNGTAKYETLIKALAANGHVDIFGADAWGLLAYSLALIDSDYDIGKVLKTSNEFKRLYRDLQGEEYDSADSTKKENAMFCKKWVRNWQMMRSSVQSVERR